MNLSNAIDVANSSLATTSQLTSIASRNISNASNKDSTRKLAGVVTDAGGGARLASITRLALSSLQDGVVSATSGSAQLSAVMSALDKLDLSANGDAASPATRLSTLQSALQTYSANPADQTAAASVISAANDVVSTL
ncbi:MAG: flagellar hook-associated protein FlgK, partial [Proteobacteria bacterium]|nr:flagellar hook-associated protein FlgK [Pseudomonadota bacterium]